jgi:hypothetical protein
MYISGKETVSCVNGLSVNNLYRTVVQYVLLKLTKLLEIALINQRVFVVYRNVLPCVDKHEIVCEMYKFVGTYSYDKT